LKKAKKKSKEANEEIRPTGINDSFKEISSDSKKGKEISEKGESSDIRLLLALMK